MDDGAKAADRVGKQLGKLDFDDIANQQKAAEDLLRTQGAEQLDKLKKSGQPLGMADDVDNLARHSQSGNPILAEVEYGSKLDFLVEGSKPSTKGKLVKKHQYENPGHHDPTGGNNPYNPKKSVLPQNHIELFKESKQFVNKKGDVLRFTKDTNGNIHRFESSFRNLYHWSGSTNGINLAGETVRLQIKSGVKELFQ